MDVESISVLTFAVFGVLQALARVIKTPKYTKTVSKIGKILNFIFSATREK